MSKYDNYAAWGFTNNPFLVTALQADTRGQRLLAGRDEEVMTIARKLHKQGKITCLDGHVGVGKTSLVNVAAYTCFQDYIKGETHQLLVPCVETFDLRQGESTEEFAHRVFRKVAQTLIEKSAQVRGMSLDMEGKAALDAWLNNSHMETVSLGLKWIVECSTGKALNNSSGFQNEGFEKAVRNWLKEIFQQRGTGGVVCVIDNVELLETAANARKSMEALRDRLFNIEGLRWVFCGANGVIHSLAASPRLSAFLNTPVIDVANIHPKYLGPLIEARTREFAPEYERAYLPINIEDMQWLYMLLNHNLRDLLGLCDEYCETEFSLGKTNLTKDVRKARFDKWLRKATSDRYNQLSSRLPKSSWAILDAAMTNDFKGTFGVNEIDALNAASRESVSSEGFKKGLRELERHGLVSRIINGDVESGGDEFKRDVCTVTSKGALVHYGRMLKEETTSISDTSWLKRVHY
ncbi:MAG: hypothetical protein K0M39_01955 [Rhizobium sp.]|nr:hypothetical protein [Rhizobium sp.]